jgi:hypothetical protein
MDGRGFTRDQVEEPGFQRGKPLHFDFAIDAAACTAGNNSRLPSYLYPSTFCSHLYRSFKYHHL